MSTTQKTSVKIATSKSPQSKNSGGELNRKGSLPVKKFHVSTKVNTSVNVTHLTENISENINILKNMSKNASVKDI